MTHHGLFVLVVTLVACGPSTTTRDARTTVAAMPALEQASIAFNGNHTAAAIEHELGRALVLYGLPANEENYSRAASALVALRKQNGVDEMHILDHMIRSHVSGVRLTFPDAAALSAVAIRLGDK